MKKYVLLTLSVLFFFACKKQSKKQNFISDLLSKMTIEEKIGQLNLPSLGEFQTGQAENSDIADKIEKGLVGGLFNVKSVKKIRTIQALAVEKSRLKIPLIFGMDVIHGYESIFPIPLGIAASWDMSLVESTARTAAREATSDGINWTFSPMVDLCRDPRWGRIAEGAGEDPYLGGQVAASMVRGYQGKDLANKETMLACVKHFALYGAPEAGRDYNTVDMSRLRMYNDYFVPYKVAIDAGAGSVMASFNEVDGVPATGNRWLMTDVLRKQWGFKGFVVTDYTGINEMISHGVGDLQTVSARALKAGIHMDMVGEGFLTTLQKSLEEGKVTEKEITNATRLILEAKYDLGLFEDPYRYCDEECAKQEIFSDTNKALVRKLASQTFVLLKNDKHILPLKKSSKVALVGPLATATTNMTGTWAVAARHKKSINLLDGLQQAIGENNVFYAKGSNLMDDKAYEERATMWGHSLKRDKRFANAMINEALRAVAKADVVVVALGEVAEMSGESSSRSNIDLPDAQRRLLRALLKTGKPVVWVLFAGRAMTITEEAQSVPAILNVWFPGSQAGLSIADVLFGDVNPSGKLPITFPKNVGQIPIFYKHKKTGRPLGNEEGKFEKFRSNYLDVSNEPLYPFGYGLSYTNFTISKPMLSDTIMQKGGELTVSVELQNTGKYDGAEVVQLYTRDLVGSITRPVKELKKFKKVFLKQDEKKTVRFVLSEDDLKFFNFDLDYVAEPGAFEVFVGNSSVTKNKASFWLK